MFKVAIIPATPVIYNFSIRENFFHADKTMLKLNISNFRHPTRGIKFARNSRTGAAPRRGETRRTGAPDDDDSCLRLEGGVGERVEGREIARGIEEDRGTVVERRGWEGTGVVQSATRTPGKGTDRYWGKLGWRWRGLFIFRGGAAAAAGREEGSRGNEWKAGGGGKISPFCVPD